MRRISRSRGNPVNALAYFSGTNLYDSGTGQWFYHTHKNVAHVELFLPKDAPLWAQELKKEISQNRKEGVQKLSNLVEAAEKRKDSCLYREFEFALPKELTPEQNMQLAREFLQDQVCGRGVAVLANFHFEEDEATGEARPHCHALFLTRRLDEKGLSYKKETEWDKKDFLLVLREQLAPYTNFHLKLHGYDLRVDHRSYAERGIDVESQHRKIIPSQSGFEQKTREEIQHRYEITRQRNVARLIKRPETVFDIVTSQQSTFMWGDVEKVLARYVREEDIFDSLNAKLHSSRELVLLREEERMTMEGVMEEASIYTTQRMIREELSLVHLAEKLGSQASHPTRTIDVEASIEHTNQALAKQGSSLSSDQISALHHITKADQLSCIVGYAGAGKSTTFKTAKEVWEASNYKVYGLAPTGRAAQNLEDIGLSAQTLHKFLKDYEEGHSQYQRNSVLVLDEAGMVDVRRFNELLQAVNHLGVKLVISGDGGQAQPIEAGAGFRLVTDRLDVKKLETVIRQKTSWQKEATRLFGAYQTREALEMYLEQGHVQFVEEKVADLETLILQGRCPEIVMLYNLSRRVCGNIWHYREEALKEAGVAPEERLKAALSHEDDAVFKKWQGIRQDCAAHMASRIEMYRSLMKEQGVDPVAFAVQFVGKDLSVEERQEETRRLIQEWKLERPEPHQPLHACDLRAATRKALVEAWERSLKDHPDQSHLIVTQTNRDTHLLNEEARHRMRLQGVIAIEEYFHTVKRESKDDFGRAVITQENKTFSQGERIVFIRNDRGLKVKNGTLGTIEEIDRQKLKVRIDGEDRVVSFASNLYPYFDRGWAVNIIKSQGSTADHVFKLSTFEENRNLAYVGMTRHRESLQMFGSALDFWREEVFVGRLSCASEKLSSLDYISEEEVRKLVTPPDRLREALSSLGNRLESLGYYSRKGWESIAERFLGQPLPEESVLFAGHSVEEAVRAKELGIRLSSQAEERSGAGQSVSPLQGAGMTASTSIRDTRNSGEGAPSPAVLSGDVDAFLHEQGRLDDLKKEGLLAENVSASKSASHRSFRISHKPHYGVDEVRRHLTASAIESVCRSLLGEPNRHLSNRRSLRYGESGSLAISLSGHSLGLWKDHSQDEGGDLFKLVMRERGLEFKEALGWVAERTGVRGQIPLAEKEKLFERAASSLRQEDEQRQHKVNRLVQASQSVQGTLGERYLREHRSIAGRLPGDVRFIPQAWHHEAKCFMPALACLARNDEGEIKTIQLTWLNPQTGHKTESALKKQSFGVVKGSSVLIQKGEGSVFLTEGVETALSIKEAGVKGDIYAVLGNANFKNVSKLLKDKTQSLILCADQDKEGSPSHKAVEKAVQSLKEEGFRVSVIRPDAALGKVDFNDILQRQGREGVQAYFKAYSGEMSKTAEQQKSEKQAQTPQAQAEASSQKVAGEKNARQQAVGQERQDAGIQTPSQAPKLRASASQEKAEAKISPFGLRPRLDEYREMVLSNRVERLLKDFLKSDLSSVKEQRIKNAIVERVSLLAAFREVDIFDSQAIKPYCRSGYLEARWKRDLSEEALSYQKTDIAKSWEIEHRAERLSSLLGRFTHERFYAHGVTPNIPQEKELLQEATALYQSHIMREKAEAKKLARQQNLSPDVAQQAVRQMMMLHEKIGIQVSVPLQKLIIEVCQQEAPRVNAYKLPVPLMKGAEEEWRRRVCQKVIESSLRNREHLSFEKAKSVEQQVWHDVLESQKSALHHQQEQQRQAERQRTRHTPSRGYEIEI